MEFNWEQIGIDNWKCVLDNNSMLKIERVGAWIVWWVFIEGKQVDSCYNEKHPTPTTIKEAKKIAEQAYINLLNNTK